MLVSLPLELVFPEFVAAVVSRMTPVGSPGLAATSPHCHLGHFRQSSGPLRGTYLEIPTDRQSLGENVLILATGIVDDPCGCVV